MKKQAFNPYLPSWEYVPDGEPHVFDGRVYVYGSHDRFDGSTFCMNDYVCWSAPTDDLSDWKYEGIIWKKTDDPNYKNLCTSSCGNLAVDLHECVPQYNAHVAPLREQHIAFASHKSPTQSYSRHLCRGSYKNGKYMYAPDVCRSPDGKYYLYYAFSPSVTRKSWAIRAAVSDSPVGPFRYHGEVDLYPWSKKFLPFDPAVYVEDGRVWLYYGSAMFFPVLGASKRKIEGGAVVELDPVDMLTVIEPPKLTVTCDKNSEYGEHAFFEASGMRKIGGRYYFVYSSLLGHELCYAIGDSPVGPFRKGGTLVSNGDVGLGEHKDVKTASNYTGNTHGNIVEIDGKHYVFYHRQTNRHCFSRQACAERIEMEADGSIKQVETTSCGLNGAPLVGEGEYEARIACNLTSQKGGRFHGVFFKKPKGVHPYFTQTGSDREGDPDQYIANFGDGATAGFKYFDICGLSEVGVKFKGKATGAVVVTNGDGTVAEIPISPSSVETVACAPWRGGDGVQALYFTFRGRGRIDLISIVLKK